MITELTEDQKLRLPIFRDEWLKIGLSTETDLHRKEAEAALIESYAFIGKSKPIVLHAQSPIQGLLMAYIVKNTIGSDFSRIDLQLFGQLSGQFRDQLSDQLFGQLSDQLFDQLSVQLFGQLSGQFRDQLSDQLFDQLFGQFRDQLGELYNAWWTYGQCEAYWLSFYSFGKELGVSYNTRSLMGLDIMSRLAKSCFMVFSWDGISVIVDHPKQIKFDDQKRLHSNSDQALLFADGYSVCSVHGTRLPEWIIMQPELITVEKIDQETNAEIRRVMIDKYGLSRYIIDSGSKVVDEGKEDHKIVGLRGSRLLKREIPDDEPIVVIEMNNSTPEPDGSIKKYHIRVDPNAYQGKAGKNVHAAMASTWRRKDGTLFFPNYKDYCPRAES